MYTNLLQVWPALHAKRPLDTRLETTYNAPKTHKFHQRRTKLLAEFLDSPGFDAAPRAGSTDLFAVLGAVLLLHGRPSNIFKSCLAHCMHKALFLGWIKWAGLATGGNCDLFELFFCIVTDV